VELLAGAKPTSDKTDVSLRSARFSIDRIIYCSTDRPALGQLQLVQSFTAASISAAVVSLSAAVKQTDVSTGGRLPKRTYLHI
jgi:hypothetical protein